MVASYKKIAPGSLKMPLKRLRFWDNSRLLATYGCPEFIFVSEGGPCVRTVTHNPRYGVVLSNTQGSGVSLDIHRTVKIKYL